MGTFDPQAFLDTTVNTASSTQRKLVPEGEYTGIVKDVKVEEWESQEKGLSGLRLDVRWVIDDAKVKEEVGLPEPTVKQGIMLDLTESGNLDMAEGRNVGLGRLREAVGLNNPGQPFSFRMMVGQVAKVQVKWRADKKSDMMYDEVRGVAKL